MSQIETIMLVTLGFVVAALVALFFGRIVWSYAVMLGKRRTERSAPATIAGLQAERDQLRAEHAMLSRKLELRLEDLKTRLAEQTAEVSRNRNRIDQLITEVETRNATIAERDAEIEQLSRNFNPLETELATRTQIVQQLKEQLRDRDDEVLALRHEFNEIASQAADRDREIALLRSELSNRPRHEDIRSEAQSAQQRLKKQIEELAGLSRQISTQRSEISKQYDEFARLREEAKQEDINKPKNASAPKIKPTRRLKATRGKQLKSVPATPAPSESAASPPAEPASPFVDGSQLRSTDVDEKVQVLRRKGESLEQQIDAAERETDQLQNELKKLDSEWEDKIAALNEAAVKPSGNGAKTQQKSPNKASPKTDTQQPSRSRQNVISLAARIRALQRRSVEN